MRILGIDAGNKESAAALVVDGALVRAALEERFTRKRFDTDMPVRAAQAILRDAGLTIDDVDVVTGNIAPSRVRSALGGQSRREAEFPRRDEGPERHGFHHLSHAAFAWLASGWQSALVLTIDNHGDDDTLVVFRAADGRLDRIASVHWQPVPVGGVYEDATSLLGFGPGGEGKFMGLAGYGAADSELAKRLLQRTGPASLASELLADPLAFEGLARAGWAPLRRPEHPDFAASVQRALEDTVLSFARDAVSDTGIRDICIAGGVALNCSLNGALAAQPWVRQVFVPPSPGDPGNAAGAALLWSHRAGNALAAGLRDGGFGARLQGEAWLDDIRADGRFELEVVGESTSAEVAARCAEDIANGRLVGWFEGGSEFGPRALGHRSMLADPRSESVRDRLNDAKLRERWRPLAPSMLLEHAPTWLQQPSESPFMLLAFGASERCKNDAPAAVHIDGTTRAQTVDPAQLPYHQLISAFHERTNVPMVLNTSFNQAGEPIVETVADAVDCAARAGLDVLWVNGVRLRPKTVSRPIDPRPKRPKLALLGPVPRSWVAPLCAQRVARFDTHPALKAVEPTSASALGLQERSLQGRVALDSTPPQQAGRIETGSATVVVPQPTSDWDGPLRQGVITTTASLHTAGVLGVRRNLRPDRLGSARTVHVTVPLGANRLASPELHNSRWRSGWSALSEGLALAAWLTDVPLRSVVARGASLSNVVIVACDPGRQCSVTVETGGTGRLPAVLCETERGQVRLGHDGRFTLTLHAGKGRERTLDTERDERGLFTALANTAMGARWPMPAELVHEAATRVDEAMTEHFRFAWPSPGAWYSGARVGQADTDARLQWKTTIHAVPSDTEVEAQRETVRLGEELAGACTVASISLRLSALLAGLRDVATFDNATPETGAQIEHIAQELGLFTARSDGYDLAVTRRGGTGQRFTLAVAARSADADAAIHLERAQGSQAHDADRFAVQRQLGALLGYPTCCVAAWHRWQKLRLDAAFTHAIARSTAGDWLAGCNARPPARAADHLPCSFSCGRTHAQSVSVVASLSDTWAKIAPGLQSALPLLRQAPGGASVEDWLAGGAERLQSAIWRVLRAPLLYVDTTRYIAFVDGVARRAKSSSMNSPVWQLDGTPIGSSQLIGRGQNDAEALLQEDFEKAAVTPIVAAAARGPVAVRDARRTWRETDVMATGAVRGDGLRIAMPAEQVLVLPFGGGA